MFIAIYKELVELLEERNVGSYEFVPKASLYLEIEDMKHLYNIDDELIEKIISKAYDIWIGRDYSHTRIGIWLANFFEIHDKETTTNKVLEKIDYFLDDKNWDIIERIFEHEICVID